ASSETASLTAISSEPVSPAAISADVVIPTAVSSETVSPATVSPETASPEDVKPEAVSPPAASCEAGSAATITTVASPSGEPSPTDVLTPVSADGGDAASLRLTSITAPVDSVAVAPAQAAGPVDAGSEKPTTDVSMLAGPHTCEVREETVGVGAASVSPDAKAEGRTAERSDPEASQPTSAEESLATGAPTLEVSQLGASGEAPEAGEPPPVCLESGSTGEASQTVSRTAVIEATDGADGHLGVDDSGTVTVGRTAVIEATEGADGHLGVDDSGTVAVGRTAVIEATDGADGHLGVVDSGTVVRTGSTSGDRLVADAAGEAREKNYPTLGDLSADEARENTRSETVQLTAEAAVKDGQASAKTYASVLSSGLGPVSSTASVPSSGVDLASSTPAVSQAAKVEENPLSGILSSSNSGPDSEEGEPVMKPDATSVGSGIRSAATKVTDISTVAEKAAGLDEERHTEAVAVPVAGGTEVAEREGVDTDPIPVRSGVHGSDSGEAAACQRSITEIPEAASSDQQLEVGCPSSTDVSAGTCKPNPTAEGSQAGDPDLNEAARQLRAGGVMPAALDSSAPQEKMSGSDSTDPGEAAKTEEKDGDGDPPAASPSTAANEEKPAMDECRGTPPGADPGENTPTTGHVTSDKPEGDSADPETVTVDQRPASSAVPPAGPSVDPIDAVSVGPMSAAVGSPDPVDPARDSQVTVCRNSVDNAASVCPEATDTPASDCPEATDTPVSVCPEAVGAAGSTVVHTAAGSGGDDRPPVTVTNVTGVERAARGNVATVEVTDSPAGAQPEGAPAARRVPPEEVEVVTDEKTNSVLVTGEVRPAPDELRSLIARSRQARDEFVQMTVGRGISPEPASRLADYFAGLDAPAPTPGRRGPRTPEVRRRQRSPDGAERRVSTDGEMPDDFDDGFDFGGGDDDEYGYDHFDSDERYSMEEQESFSDASQEEAYTEEEMRGLSRPLDFTLTTIIEESCEESDVDERAAKERTPTADPSSELEKYFFFGLGNGPYEPRKVGNEESECNDSFSSDASASVYSELLDTEDADGDPVEQAAARYFNKGFLGLGLVRQPSIRSAGEDSEVQTDGSGSVGSDSEGQPSPEQRRKKVTRSRYRAQSGDVSGSGGDVSAREVSDKSDGTSSDEDNPPDPTADETAFEKTDGQFDTIKRRKKKKLLASGGDHSDRETALEKVARAMEEPAALAVARAPEPLAAPDAGRDASLHQLDKTGEARQSRDSGFLGSSDDLLKEAVIKETEERPEEAANRVTPDSSDSEGTARKTSSVSGSQRSASGEEGAAGGRRSTTPSAKARDAAGQAASSPGAKTRNKVIRKDSFNNWSSDEETNILMGRLRQFFRTTIFSAPRTDVHGPQAKPAQLLSFESELTRMMKSVPGINEAQVREIVEYLSSEDTWSDSYDSSDYTSSDLEGAYAAFNPAQPDFMTQIQKQISQSCQQIIQKYDGSDAPPPPPVQPPAPAAAAPAEPNDAVAVYERLMGSLRGLSQPTQPPPPCARLASHAH
ncbi:uncharacterized protein LOC119102299, partial [Pollicipes pollicipes]|uniref:uncharacterized protein LOC119102299 n=1 Tax=Pollicipes pollicipes TaxID=41117 RepID=UPI0018849B87